jgi:hypothetical protein
LEDVRINGQKSLTKGTKNEISLLSDRVLKQPLDINLQCKQGLPMVLSLMKHRVGVRIMRLTLPAKYLYQARPDKE